MEVLKLPVEAISDFFDLSQLISRKIYYAAGKYFYLRTTAASCDLEIRTLDTWCGSLRNFLPFRFYVKSIST